MPSYPTSPHSFADFANGALSDAPQVNDIYDEVEAIEAGLLNGTARLNSSNSTLANLSVPGGSTLAGTLTVGGRIAGSSGLSVVGNSTLGSTITLGTLPYIFPSSGGSTGELLTLVSTSGSTMTLEWRANTANSAPTVKLSHDAAQAIESTDVIGLNWNTELYDSTGMHSTASNSSRITFVGSTGVYHVGAVVTFSTFAGDFIRRVVIVMNDSSRITEALAHDPNANAKRLPITLSADVRVAALTDYITVRANSDSGTGTIVAESTGSPMGFWAHQIST